MEETHDKIDVKEALTGPIKEVIKRLQKLAKEYPDGEIDVTTDYEYGESYPAAYLEFYRPMTPLETELREVDGKLRQYAALRQEATVFDGNGVPYPRADEMEKLRDELGHFADGRGHLQIYDGQIVMYDMLRGAFAKDGTWRLRTMFHDWDAGTTAA